jgi:hypothetical protein
MLAGYSLIICRREAGGASSSVVVQWHSSSSSQRKEGAGMSEPGQSQRRPRIRRAFTRIPSPLPLPLPLPGGLTTTASPPSPASPMKRKRAPAPLDHPVLRRFYPALCTLRHHLLSRLPTASRSRRRRISTLGLQDQGPAGLDVDVDIELARLLDSTLVGISHHVDAADTKERDHDVDCFTQQLSQAGTYQPGYLLQPEVGRLACH